MAAERLYRVTFNVQKDRWYKDLSFYVYASSKKAAIEDARTCWYALRDSHMFHCEAERVDTVPEGIQYGAFHLEARRWVTWGNVRR